jgi:hypothetical protein
VLVAQRTQKLDFQKVCKYRSNLKSQSKAGKKAALVMRLREDAVRTDAGHINIRTTLPAECLREEKTQDCCTTAFCKFYGVSSKSKAKYCEIVKRGEEVVMHEESEMLSSRGEARRHHALLWMKDFFHTLCDILPTTDYTNKNYHLPKCVSKNSVFLEYHAHFTELEEKFSDPDLAPYTRTTFGNLWNKEFPYVTIPEHTAFSVCTHCAALHDRLITASKEHDRATLLTLKRLRRLHLDFISNERMLYREHQRLAREYPDQYLCLTVDGMDQAKLRGPHFAGGGIPKGEKRALTKNRNKNVLYIINTHLF